MIEERPDPINRFRHRKGPDWRGPVFCGIHAELQCFGGLL